jgi:two-component sensor histidine kinase
MSAKPTTVIAISGRAFALGDEPLQTRDGRDHAEPDLSALVERQLGFDALLENMAEGFAMCEAIWDEQGSLSDYTILEMNTALQRMLGVGPEAIGTKLREGPGDWADWLKLCERVLKTGEPARFEGHTPRTDAWHEVSLTRVTNDKMAQIFFDITERKRAEARQASLFDELNHRVSNNLMLVSSILQMKARETDNDDVRDQLLRAVSRVGSIAQVHRVLYRGARTEAVDFSAYLKDLCAGVRASLIQDDRIKLEVESEPVFMPVDTAVPLGMVVNELVTNAVKYAYPPPANGPISVRLARDGDELVLAVHDIGRGLPDSAESRPGGGLGMKLIRSLVAQVHGVISTAGPPGAAFEIRLPAPD